MLDFFLTRSVVILTNGNLLILHNKFCQHLEDGCNSVNQYFPNIPRSNVTKSSMGKDPVNVQEISRDFNVTEYKKFTNMALDSTVRLTFMKLLVKFEYSVKENPHLGVLVVAQWLTNPTRNLEVGGSIPGLAQWVKDPVLP